MARQWWANSSLSIPSSACSPGRNNPCHSPQVHVNSVSEERVINNVMVHHTFTVSIETPIGGKALNQSKVWICTILSLMIYLSCPSSLVIHGWWSAVFTQTNQKGQMLPWSPFAESIIFLLLLLWKCLSNVASINIFKGYMLKELLKDDGTVLRIFDQALLQEAGCVGTDHSRF